MSNSNPTRREFLRASGGAIAGVCISQQQGDAWIDLKLKDGLKYPGYSWPLTKLSYAVGFSSLRARPEDLRLTELASAQSVPFQLTGVRLEKGAVREAVVHFLSDLPSGAEKTFRLSYTGGASAEFEGKVRATKTSQGVTLENGRVRVQLPPLGVSRKAPAAILRFGDERAWLARGEFANAAPTALRVEELSLGDVLAEYRLNYTFDNSRRYSVIVRLTARMDFVELDERIEGFTTKDGAAWRMVWNEFTPTHRYCPNRPTAPAGKEKKNYVAMAWEPIEGTAGDENASSHPGRPEDQRSGPDGRLPIKIAPYHNWLTWWRTPTAAFWNDSTTIGVFITEIEKWNDGRYAIWASKDDLSIHFYYQDRRLSWRLPLAAGTRSIALTAYPHQKDVDLINQTGVPLLYVDALRRWYGWIHLDKVRQWVLDYEAAPKQYPRYFDGASDSVATGKALQRAIANLGMIKSIPTGGERSNYGPTPVGSRPFFTITTQADQAWSTLSSEDRRRLRAAYLFLAYLHMDETLMPMRTMFAGHPNFMADVKGVPALVAFLFPDHPEAAAMADHFEKFLALNLKYHVRPAVEAWGARGGRWTENLSAYTWAALVPMLRSSYLLHHRFDGRNRMLQPGVVEFADWLLNTLSAPLHGAGDKRIHPPQGAHSARTPEERLPPYMLRVFAQELMHYAPLTAEHLLWATSADDPGFESRGPKDQDPWRKMLKGEWENNRGTNPRLVSSKFTGYGFVLRSHFGDSGELTVYLQQIDAGPNYRWGRAGKGGNGVVYYYAGGRSWSHNGPEDVGDAYVGDVERCTNFGVRKAGNYRSIGPYRSVGMNELTEPLLDFGFAQFAQVNAGGEAKPDYRSRSVLVVGNEYLVIYDDVRDEEIEGRFSWFVAENGEFPQIHQLSPGATPVDASFARPPVDNYAPPPPTTKGRYYDGRGSFLTLITHLPEVRAQKMNFGCVVGEGGDFDFVFRTGEQVVVHANGMDFFGDAGVIRRRGDAWQAALFRGSRIGVPGMRIEVRSGKAAVSLESSGDGFAGMIQAAEKTRIHFTAGRPDGFQFYLDGLRFNPEAQFPVGAHRWQWTRGAASPGAIRELRTIVTSGGFTAHWSPVPGATSYEAQLSEDGGATWKGIADRTAKATITVDRLADGRKYHLRVIAYAETSAGPPSHDYPVYVIDRPPHPPEGLLARRCGDRWTLSWGEILGAGEYRLYRRKKGDSWSRIYDGFARRFTDQRVGDGIYEYRVTALNGNGESEPSVISDTDPSRLINWDPKPDEGFRRDTESAENGYPEFNHWIEEAAPTLDYPGQKSECEERPRNTRK
jgi:hypothetical protein